MAGPVRRAFVTRPARVRRPSAVARVAALAALLVLPVLFRAAPARAAAPARSAATASSPGCGGYGVALPTQPNLVVPGTTPILFVHGIDSDPATWTKGSVGLTLKAPLYYVHFGLDKAQQVTAYTFDWSRYSGFKPGSKLAWVKGPPAPGPGPLLAQAIQCLAKKSGHQVIIIAHSMGGLVTKYASTLGPTARDIAAVFTLGTPFRGSWLDSLANNQLGWLSQSVAASCAFGAWLNQPRTARPGTKQHAKPSGKFEQLCRLASQRDDPGMKAMRTTTSAKWHKLQWKGSFPVFPLAASIQATGWQPMLLFEPSLPIHGLGDGVVSTTSELNGKTNPTTTCTVPKATKSTMLVVLGLILTSPCFHTNEPDNQALLDKIISTINQKDLIPTAAPVPVDWNNRHYSLTCDNIVQTPVSVAFSGGKATARGQGIGSYHVWYLSIEQVAHVVLPSLGDVTAVLFSCSPQPSNFGVQELRVYHTASGSEVGRIPDLPTDGGLLPGAFTPGSIGAGNGHLSADAMLYGPGDSHASGPSVPAHVSWAWNGREFTMNPIPGVPQPGSCTVADLSLVIRTWNPSVPSGWQVTKYACGGGYALVEVYLPSAGNGFAVLKQVPAGWVSVYGLDDGTCLFHGCQGFQSPLPAALLQTLARQAGISG